MIFSKKELLNANKWIVEKKLVELTWGNVSCFNRRDNVVFMKPSGVNLNEITENDISSLKIDQTRLSGKKPSVDTPTHLEIYRNFNEINCVIHTHSKYATIFAQANMPIPCLGTTHADYFYGDIPCVNHPSITKVSDNYELETGKEICNFFKKNNIDPLEIGGCLVNGHGVFCWGNDIEKTLEKALVLEILAEMAHKTILLNPNIKLKKFILDKHFLRKHGAKKYYGQ